MEDVMVKVSDGEKADLSQWWPATVEALLGPLYRFVRSLAPAQAVDDLVQETFVAASRSIRQFDGRCPLWNWLTVIARRKIADYYRRSDTCDVLLEAIDGLADDTTVQRALLSEAPLPDEVCARREFQALARAALAALAPEQQDCLIGRYCEGLSLEQLSRRAGASRGVLNTRLYRARQALRQAFLKLLSDRGKDVESLP
jgi:RNA polymerase sigma factor (sigma-70 family)